MNRSYGSVTAPLIATSLSLAGLVLVCFGLAVVAFVAVLLRRFGRRGLYALAAIALGLLAAATPIEIAGQIHRAAHPGYTILFLQPDRVIGWKQVPGLRWTWTGGGSYAREFSVDIETNPAGFRDAPRSLEKPESVVRIALLGDSFVEAAQVPFEKTAAHLLEGKLGGGGATPRYEVLNFGISGFGVGQYLLTWEEYARRYAPDVVFAFVAPMHVNRTIVQQGNAGFGSAASPPLWIRPTFRLEGDVLVREPARDYDAFVAMQQDLIRREFGGTRMRPKGSRLFLCEWLVDLWKLRKIAPTFGEKRRPDPGAETLRVNLRVLEELGRQARAQNARLAVVDAASAINPGSKLGTALERFCRDNGFGYVPLGDDLLAAHGRGIVTTWRLDGHFNEAGNEIFAAAMHRWLTTN